MESEEPKFNEEKFKNGVFYLINSWPVLLLSIENGWINENNQKLRNSKEISENSKKKTWFQSSEEIIKNFSEDLSNYILDFDVSQFDIEDYLLDKMEENFYVIIEDNSEKQLAKLLLDFFEDLTNGSDKVYNQIVQIHDNAKKYKIEGHKDKKATEKSETNKIEKLENEIKNLDLEESKNNIEDEKPMVDEDGFILVKKKGKK